MLRGFAVAGALALSAPVYAQEPAAENQAEEHKAEAHEGEAHEAEGINWWSWDYGQNAKDPAHKGWPPPFGFALINFAIFLGIMSRLAWKPLKQFVQERHDSIGKNLNEAARLRKEAEALLKQYESKIGAIDGEIDTLLAQIRKEA